MEKQAAVSRFGTVAESRNASCQARVCWGMLEMRNIQAHGESSKAAALDCEFNSVAVACKIVIVNLHLHRVGRGVLPFTDDK